MDLHRVTDDDAQLRRRQDDARKALEALSSPEGRAAAVYSGQIFDGGAIPNSVPRMFYTHPFGASATEAAGAVPTVTIGTETVPVLVLGPGVPVAGDRLIARQVGGTWVAPMMGGYPSGPSTPCHPCAIPRRDLNLSLTYRNDNLFGLGSVAIPLRYVSAGTCPGGITGPDGTVTGVDYWLADDGDPICNLQGGMHGHYTISDYDDVSSVGFNVLPDHYFLLSCRPITAGGADLVILTHYIPRLFGGPIRVDYSMLSASNGYSCTPFMFDSQTTFPNPGYSDRVIVSVL
jgi:hypothetical protein